MSNINRINIIMLDIQNYPTVELAAGKSIQKKGEYYTNFYYLQEGKVSVTINQITIQISTPMFLGDYQILQQIQYRTSIIKTLTKCRLKAIPIQFYNSINHHHEALIQAFSKFKIKSRILNYWLKKLFAVSLHKKNDLVICSKSIGIVLSGDFKHASKIPIIKMRQQNLQLLRNFQISIIGENEIFEENVVCETHRGMTAILEEKYTEQLSSIFQEFGGILSVFAFKKKMHLSMSHQIAVNCRKKRNLFRHMVPTTLNHSIMHEEGTMMGFNRQNSKQSKGCKDTNEMKRLNSSDEVFTVKNNITQFLHNQWRRGLSLKLPRKPRQNPNVGSFRKKNIEEFKHSQMIKLSIPRQFKEIKFNFKMLLKTKESYLMKSKRIKTQAGEEKDNRLKLLFQD